MKRALSFRSIWLGLRKYCCYSYTMGSKPIQSSSEFSWTIDFTRYFKVNSVQEACAKCFAVHMLKFEILQFTWKKLNKEHQTLSFQVFIDRFSILMLFVLFFYVVCKISNFNMWTQSIWPNRINKWGNICLKSTQYKELVPNALLFTY